MPWPEQLYGQPVPTEQSAPPQPGGQTHEPSTQPPRPEQLWAHSRSVQPGPLQPRAHTHSPPSMQLPWHVSSSAGSGQLHASGQTSSSHAGPPQPLAHAQRSGATHSPRPEQPRTLEQSDRLHESPKRPASHSHVKGAVHTPCPEQLSVQMGVPHDGPAQPSAQAQLPPGRHTPCGALHSSWQWRAPQSAPPQPASHSHSPCRQIPRPEHSSGWPGQASTSHAVPVHRVATDETACSSDPIETERALSTAWGAERTLGLRLLLAPSRASASASWQTQWPGETHVPRPEQLRGQTASSQRWPVQPAKHSHRPGATQLPRTQPASQSATSQPEPP